MLISTGIGYTSRILYKKVTKRGLTIFYLIWGGIFYFNKKEWYYMIYNIIFEWQNNKKCHNVGESGKWHKTQKCHNKARSNN